MMMKKMAYPTTHHTVVKYGDMECLLEILEISDDDTDINQVDSEGRAAMDLAALTGQVPFLQVYYREYDYRFKFKNATRMKTIAKIREAGSQKYLENVRSSIQ